VVADGAGHRRHHRLGNFVLTGTAAAGEYFQAPSILHAQALDVIVNFLRTGSTAGALMHGRPPAGPSIAISFLLVAIACSFAGCATPNWRR
jgi:hypothetical protein